MNKTLKTYLITATVGALLALGIMALEGIFSAADTETVLKYLCDGLFIAGALMAGIAGLLFVYDQGMFDVLTYGVHQVVRTFTKRDLREEKKDFYDYRKEKHAEKKTMWHVLFCGVGFVLLGVIVYMIYNSLYPR